jgi:hypothetical protein
MLSVCVCVSTFLCVVYLPAPHIKFGKSDRFARNSYEHYATGGSRKDVVFKFLKSEIKSGRTCRYVRQE